MDLRQYDSDENIEGLAFDLLTNRPELLEEFYLTNDHRPLFSVKSAPKGFYLAYKEFQEQASSEFENGTVTGAEDLLTTFFKYSHWVNPETGKVKAKDVFKTLARIYPSETYMENCQFMIPLFESNIIEFAFENRFTVNDIEYNLLGYLRNPNFLYRLGFDFNAPINNPEHHSYGNRPIHICFSDTFTRRRDINDTLEKLVTLFEEEEDLDIDVNLKSRDGRTPLSMLAERCLYMNEASFIFLLIRMGADPNIRDDDGIPTTLKCTNRQSIKLLLDNGVDPNAEGPDGLRLIHQEVLKDSCRWLIEKYDIDCDVKVTEKAKKALKNKDLIVGTDLILYSDSILLTLAMLKKGANPYAYHPKLGGILHLKMPCSLHVITERQLQSLLARGAEFREPRQLEHGNIKREVLYHTGELLTKVLPLKYHMLNSLVKAGADLSLVPESFKIVSEGLDNFNLFWY